MCLPSLNKVDHLKKKNNNLDTWKIAEIILNFEQWGSNVE